MLRTALLGFGLGFAALALGIAGFDGEWFGAHGLFMVSVGLVPLLSVFHLHALVQFVGATLPTRDIRLIAAGLLGGGTIAAVGVAMDFAWILVLGLIISFIATVELSRIVIHRLPRTSIKTDDPLSKGDDACVKQMRMAHYFLPTGYYWMALGAAPVDLPYLDRIFAAGMHELLVGYALVSMYAIGHLWIPRLSGIPAIAEGAIKGELHTTMLGLAGVTLGFLTGYIGFFLAFAPFVFIGFFTYMGVLGANIMKNKSQTHRVTPEFVYVPWVFAAVFWMICGVLMGLFLNVVPETLAANYGSLRYMHMHVGLAAGMVQLILGITTRILPARWSMGPPRFDGLMKWSFYGFNAAFALILWGHFRGGTQDVFLVVGAIGFVLSLLMYVQAIIQKPKPKSD